MEGQRNLNTAGIKCSGEFYISLSLSLSLSLFRFIFSRISLSIPFTCLPHNHTLKLASQIFNSSEYGNGPVLLHFVCSLDDSTTIQIKKETTPDGQVPIVLVTGPYSTKNEPTLEDQRLNRAQPVLYLDRRTHRGDPPAWLPPLWSKPGIYPLTPESINIIKLVSSFPFDRNASASATTFLSPNVSGMIGSPGFYQPPNMIFGGANSGNMMMGSPMIPPLLQQQLQFQYQQQQQQQNLQAVSPSPSPYAQRKPITSSIPLVQSPQLQSSSTSPIQVRTRENKAKHRHSLSTPSPSTSLSSSLSSSTAKTQRKKVKSLVEKRHVRFTEDQPEIKFFDKDIHGIDGQGIAEDEGLYYSDDGDPYSRYSVMDQGNEDYYYYDDNEDYMHQRGIYEHYDEGGYDSRHYPDYYYPDETGHYEDYDNYLVPEGGYKPDYSFSRTKRTPHNRSSTHLQTPHYEDEENYPDRSGYGSEWIDEQQPYYDNDDMYAEDDYEQGIQRPWSTGRLLDYKTLDQRHHHLSDRSPAARPFPSSLTSSRSKWYDKSPDPHTQDYHDPIQRRSISSCANRHMWKPSRANHPR